MSFDIKPSDMTIFNYLAELPETFYLTGSRYFNTASPASDYDFFVQDGPSLTNKLMESKFRFKQLDCYGFNDIIDKWDQLTRSVLRSIQSGVQVDVQIVTDALLKKRVQEVILTHKLLQNVDKYEAVIIWNTIITLLTNITDENLFKLLSHGENNHGS